MQMFETESESGSRDRKFVRYREKFKIEKFEMEKGYVVFLGKISRDRTFCSR